MKTLPFFLLLCRIYTVFKLMSTTHNDIFVFWYIMQSVEGHWVMIPSCLFVSETITGRKVKWTCIVNTFLPCTENIRDYNIIANKTKVYDLLYITQFHDDVIKWRHSPRNWPFEREFTDPGEFPTQRPVTRSFDVFFDLRLNKRLSKQPWGWWFETPPWSIWRQCNVPKRKWAKITTIILKKKIEDIYGTSDFFLDCQMQRFLRWSIISLIWQ